VTIPSYFDVCPDGGSNDYDNFDGDVFADEDGDKDDKIRRMVRM
jgi:hypothetical protein